MLFLLPKVFSPFLFLLMTPDTVWHSIRNDAILRLICWSSHTLNTAPGHSSSCLGTDVVWTLIYISVNNPICCPMSGFFHLFSPTENMWHQSFFLARFSHFNPSCECRKEKKKDGSVSMEAHSSWGSLITVMAERETEDERRERWSAADMAGISPEMRWINLFSGYALLLIWGCDITSCSIPKGSESVKQESKSKWRGSECIVVRPTNVLYIDCALNYCQSSSSQRPLIPHEDNWVMYHENV